MKAVCPECKHSFKVPVQLIGRTVKCPECREPMEIIKYPKSPVVKFFQAALAFIIIVMIGFSLWVFLARSTNEKLSGALEQIQKETQEFKKAEQKRINEAISSLQAKVMSAIEEVEIKSAELTRFQGQLELTKLKLRVKENEIGLLTRELGELNELVREEAQEQMQRDTNLLYFLQKDADIRSLSGIKDLQLQIEVSDILAGETSLDTEQLLSRAESQLSQSGLTVLPEPTTNTPLLIITIKSAGTIKEKESFEADITAELKQTVLLEREPAIICPQVITWQQSGKVTVKPDGNLEEINEVIDNYIVNFIIDYQNANTSENTAEVE